MVETIELGANQISRRAIVNAPAAVIFELVANPRRHHELDGSGTVGPNISGPERLTLGATFSTHMRMFGVPYKTTCTITQFQENAIIEWQVGGRQKWRWELRELEPEITEVTETWDIRGVTGAVILNITLGNRTARGLEQTLQQLQQRFP